MNASETSNQPAEFVLPIKNYHEFYRFYLTEHRSLASRRLHVVGSSIGLYFFGQAIRKRQPKYALYGLASGYACAWVGHFFFEHNIVPDIMIINGIPKLNMNGNASAIALNILLLFLCLW